MKKVGVWLLAGVLGMALALPLGAQGLGLPDGTGAPVISGMSVQGVFVNLDIFEGDKNVLVVFYRMHD